MNAIIETINAAGQAFIRFALPMFIQSSVLILILLLVDMVLRRRVRAVFRYWIWMLVLLKLVLPPSLWSPVSIGTWLGETLEPPALVVSESPVATQVDKPMVVQRPKAKASPEPVDWVGDGTTAGLKRVPEGYVPTRRVASASDSLPTEVPENGQGLSREPTPDRATPEVDPAPPTATPLSWQALVFLAWMAIALALLLLLIQRAWFVRGLVAQSQEAPPRLRNALGQCRVQVGVKRAVPIRVSSNATSPAVCGLFRPSILIPKTLVPRLQPHDLQAVLLHELAHIKRGDLWVNLIQTLLQVIYFYNPFLWLANVVIRRVREQAVDEAVLVAMGDAAHDYPETLLNVAKLAFKQRPALSLRLIGVVESKSALRSRIKHILHRPLPKTAKLGLLGLMAVCLIAALLLPMARASEEGVSVVNNGPLDIRLIGVCPDGDGQLYDVNGKKLNITMPPLGTSDRPWDSNEVRRDFVFDVPHVDGQLLFDGYSRVRPARVKKAIGGGFVEFDPLTDAPNLILSAEFYRTYPEPGAGSSPRRLPVRKVDLTLKYFLGLGGEARCTFTGPFAEGTTVQADDGRPYELTLEPTRPWTESELEFYLGTNQPLERDVPVILYDADGMRYQAWYMGRRDGRPRYHANAVRWGRVAAITVGERPYEITFQNVVVDYPEHPRRTYPEHLDRVEERLRTGWPPKDLTRYVFRNAQEVASVIDIIRGSDLIDGITDAVRSDSPRLDFTGLDPASQEKIRATAASWIDSPCGVDGIVLGLAGHWPEFFDLAAERLQSDGPASLYYPKYEYAWRRGNQLIAEMLEKRWGPLSASEVQKLTDCIQKTTDGEVLDSLFESLEATNSPEATKAFLELAQDQRPWIWWHATEMWCERVSRADWADGSLPEEMKLRLYLVKSRLVDADVKAKARALLAEQLTPQLSMMLDSDWNAINSEILRQFDRTTVTQIYIDYLRRMQSAIAGPELDFPVFAWVSFDIAEVVRSLNLWYDMNIGDMGTSRTQRPYGEKRPTHAVLNRVISETLTWYAANPDPVPVELSLEGRVVDEAGQPIVNAQVALEKYEEYRAASGIAVPCDIEVDTCRTDFDGRFMFTGLASHEPYHVNVVAAGYRWPTRTRVRQLSDGRYELSDGSTIKMRQSDFAGGSASGGLVPGTNPFLDSLEAAWDLLFKNDTAVEQLKGVPIGLPLTERAEKVVSMAEEEARRLNHDYIRTEHILLALARQDDAVSAKVLANLGAKLDTLRAEVNKFVRPGEEPVVQRALPCTVRVEHVIQDAQGEALILGHDYIGTEHILLGLMQERKGVAAQVLASLGVTSLQVRTEILKFVRPGTQESDDDARGDDNHIPRTIVLPDVDHQAVMLDLATMKLIAVPKAESPDEIWQAIRKGGRGDLSYDGRSLILVRGAICPQAEKRGVDRFSACAIGRHLPQVLTITTAEGQRYRITIVAADKRNCTLLTASVIPAREGAGGGALVEPPKGAGMLEFRIAPRRDDLAPEIVEDYRKELVEGRIPSDRRYRWFPLRSGMKPPFDSIAETYEGTTYVLLWNEASHAMLAHQAWGLTQVARTTDGMGRAAIRLRFDEQGTSLFHQVTAASAKRALAIVLDGKVVAAPEIAGPISGREILISGTFSDREIDGMIAVLRRSAGGMIRVLRADGDHWTILDLATDTVMTSPRAVSPSEIAKSIRELGKGDLTYEVQDGNRQLLLLRGATSEQTQQRSTEPFDAQVYRVGPQLPQALIVTTAEGRQYKVTILAADDKSCTLKFPLPPDLGAGTHDLVEPPEVRSSDNAAMGPYRTLQAEYSPSLEDGIVLSADGRRFLLTVRRPSLGSSDEILVEVLTAADDLDIRLRYERYDGSIAAATHRSPLAVSSQRPSNAVLCHAFQISEWPENLTRIYVDYRQAVQGGMRRNANTLASAETGPGPLGRHGLSFDGVDDCLIVPPGLSLSSPFFIEVWFKPDPQGQADLGMSLMQKGRKPVDPSKTQDGGFILRRRQRAGSSVWGSLSLLLGDAAGRLFEVGSTHKSSSNRSGWFHECTGYQGRDYMPAPDQPLLIGASFPCETGQLKGHLVPFKGEIAEIRIWNKVLTDQEMRYYADMALTGNEPGLVACWDFDRQAGGQTVYDLSPNAYHAQLGKTTDADTADPKWVDLTNDHESVIDSIPSDVPGPSASGEARFTVRGVVTGTSGEPMEGVWVNVDCGFERPQRAGRTLTDKSGRYTLDFNSAWVVSGADPYGVGIQPAFVYAQKEGYYETSLRQKGNLAIAGKVPGPNEQHFIAGRTGVILANEPYELNFTMAPAALLTGELIGVDGRPLSNRDIYLHSDQIYPPGRSYTRVKTRFDGTFGPCTVPCTSFRFSCPEPSLAPSDEIAFSHPGTWRLIFEYQETGPQKAVLVVKNLQTPQSTPGIPFGGVANVSGELPANQDKGALQFATVPKRDDIDADLVHEYVDALEQGQLAPYGDYAWFEVLPGIFVPPDAVTREHDGKSWLLLWNRQPFVMRPDKGWQLERFQVTEDDMGRPAILLWFDAAGSDAIEDFTEANADSHVATVVDNRVVSAPLFLHPVRMVMIAGPYSSEQIDWMLGVLGTLTPAPDPAEQIERLLRRWLRDLATGDMAGVKKAYRPDAPQAESDARDMEELLSLNLGWRFSLLSVAWNDEAAMAVSGKLNKGDPKSEPEPVVIVWNFDRFDGRWVITDIDLEQIEGLQGENARFLENHSGAQAWYVEPGPTDGSANPVPSASQTASAGISGRVLDPLGMPVARAHVALCTSEKGVSLFNTQLWSMHSPEKTAEIVDTDSEGWFSFSDAPAEGVIIASHESGFARVAIAGQMSSVPVQLERWGRIEGTLYVGREPAIDENMCLVSGPRLSQTPRIDYDYQTKTGIDGYFVFENVAPGWLSIGRVVQEPTDPKVLGSVMAQPIHVKPGETLRITIGGTGRPITGEFVLPADDDSDGEVTWGICTLDMVRFEESMKSQVPRPAGYDQMTDVQKAQWYRQWLKTPEGQAYWNSVYHDPNDRMYTFFVNENNRFCIDDVVPGQYRFDVRRGTRTGSGNHVKTESVYHATIEVPSAAEMYSDQLLDFGAIALTTQWTYDMAPTRPDERRLGSVAIFGRVLDPIGMPVAGAQVALCTRGKGVRIVTPRLELIDGTGASSEIVETDAGGRFSLSKPLGDFAIVASHETGFAYVDGKDLASPATIRLERWGQIEGTLYKGREPAPNEVVTVVSTPNPTFPMDHRQTTRTTRGGRFVFRKVMPGRLGIVGRLPSTGGRNSTTLQTINVEPGQTLEITLGAGGRPVVGTLALPPDDDRSVSEMRMFAMLDKIGPEVPWPDGYDRLTGPEKSRWYQQWSQTPEGRAHSEATYRDPNARNYPFNVDDDWGFRIENVVPGRYQCRVMFHPLRPQDSPDSGRSYQAVIEVPPMPETYSDQPLDLGTVTLTVPARADSDPNSNDGNRVWQWLETGVSVPPDANDTRAVALRVRLDGIGSDPDDRVFISTVRDTTATEGWQYRFVLTTKAGQTLEPIYYASLDQGDGKLWEKYTFDTPYIDWRLESFRFQRRLAAGQVAAAPTSHGEILAVMADHPVLPVTSEAPSGRYALSFDGRDDYLYVPDSKSLREARSLTIEMWLKPQFPPGPYDHRPGWALLAKGGYLGTGRASCQGFGMVLRKMDDRPDSVMFHTSRAAEDSLFSTGTLWKQPDDWMHISETFERDSFIPAPGYPLVFGRFLIPTENSFQGQIAEVRIWDTAESGVIEQYENTALTGNEPGLLACWTFEEGAGPIARDIGPHANHARLGKAITADDCDPTWLDLQADQNAPKQISGRVLDPNGAPAAGAQVAWIDAEKGVTITDGRLMAPRFGNRQEAPIIETDTQGWFRFEDEPNDGFTLIAAHEAGFAQVDSEEFDKDRVIRLQRWGRVEGQVTPGRQPLEGKIWMDGLPNSTWFKYRCDYRYATLCDSEGRFAFGRVPPGWFEVGYLVRTGDFTSSLTSRTPVVVEAGRTATVTLGGEGRPIIGRFVPPSDWDGPVYFGAGLRALDTARPEPSRPDNYDLMTQREQQEWIKRWNKTPEAEAYRDALWHNLNQRHYSFRIHEDGTFRIEDVIPGQYNFTVWLEERNSPEGPGEFGGYSGAIEVPPMAKAYSDEPLDVGDLVLKMHRPLHVGDMAPLFEAQTLDGHDIRLADYRGRFVLLNFSSPVFNPEVDRLKELQATYGPTGQLQIIGLGGTDTLEEVKKYVEENDIEWPEIYFGPDWDGDLFKRLGGQMQILLIDPEGKIVATWLRGDKLTDTVREAIENTDLGISGRVLDPNGLPVPRAQVALCTPDRGVAVVVGHLDPTGLGERGCDIQKTDVVGRFAFNQRPEEFEIVVACDSGFARFTDEQFNTSPVIRLQPWGRIEGTVHIGRKPGANRLVQLQDLFETETGNLIQYKDRSEADTGGRFVLEKVPPRWAGIGYVGGPRSRLSCWTNGRPIHILPGETVNVAIGATGRPVIARLAVPTDYEMPTDLDHVVLVFTTVTPGMPFPEDYARMTQDQQYEWRQQWLSTPEGHDYLVSVRHNPNYRYYAAALETDNTFRIEDVIPGRYELTVVFHLNPPRQLIIVPQGTIDVPAMAEEYSDEPFDLGDLVLDTAEASVIP